VAQFVERRASNRKVAKR